MNQADTLEQYFFDNRCNHLKKRLSHRNYEQKLVREQILNARAVFKETLLSI